MGKNVWVSGNRSKGFSVKSEGASKAARVYDKQSDAIAKANEMGEARKSEVIVQNVHGQIREKNSHGHDPNPPTDKK